MMVDLQFLPSFLDEAEETLEQWESVCLRLENNPLPELQNELFRYAHNIKGSSKSVGLLEFSDLVHKAEDVITRVKSGGLTCTPEVIESLLDCQKILLDWVQSLRSNPNFIPNLQTVLVSLNRWAEVQDSVPNRGEANSKLEPPIDGFTMFANVESTASQVKPRDLGTILIDSGRVSPEQIEMAVKQQNRKLGEVLVENGIVDQASINAALEIQKQSGLKMDETIRVSLRKLDDLIKLVGELSIQHSIICNAKDEGKLLEGPSLEAIGLSQKVIQDLQSEAMSLRMQPLEGLFQRMERVSRDVARQQNKSIRITLKGTEVELDRTVIEQMKDPLVHILRNAVDHGIEDPNMRQPLGKDPTAQIIIEGIQTASNVSIRITDDGRGLDDGKILAKAVQKGLIEKGTKLAKDEIFSLIFRPGFSTAEKVTEVSGRGVGLDVVKKAVDELGGSIQIESEKGKGTSFVITLPSTLSVLDAIIIRLDQKLYSVPVQDVEEVVDLATAHIETTTNKGRILNLRGRVIPLESLSTFLSLDGIDARSEQPRTDSGVALVSRFNSTSVAFAVERIAGQQSIVVRKLEGKLSQVPGFAGGTILSSGEPAMIVHLPHVAKTFVSALRSA